MSFKFNNKNTLRTYEIPTGEKNKSFEVFNAIDVVSGTETFDMSDLDYKLINYLQKTGGTILNLSISDNLYVNGETQNSFTAEKNVILNDVNNKTTNIVFGSNNTTINGFLSLVNNLQVVSIGNGDVNNTQLS